MLLYLEIADRTRTTNDAGALTLLCERQGLEYGTVAKLLFRFQHPDTKDGGVRSLDFDMADKLLCGSRQWDKWWDELSEYYELVDLTWRKCECVGCEKMLKQGRVTQGPTVKRFCSKSCADAASRLRTGKTQSRRKNYGGNMAPRTGNTCRNNHERTPETTKYRNNGKMECLLCHRLSAKRAYKKKMSLKRAAVAVA